MYYIWSLVISIIIFIIIQYIENDKYNKIGEKYNPFTIINLVIFVILYVLLSIIFFYILSDKKIFSSNEEIDINNNIDPLILKKIPDTFNTGFEPFDEMDDE